MSAQQHRKRFSLDDSSPLTAADKRGLDSPLSLSYDAPPSYSSSSTSLPCNTSAALTTDGKALSKSAKLESPTATGKTAKKRRSSSHREPDVVEVDRNEIIGATDDDDDDDDDVKSTPSQPPSIKITIKKSQILADKDESTGKRARTLGPGRKGKKSDSDFGVDEQHQQRRLSMRLLDKQLISAFTTTAAASYEYVPVVGLNDEVLMVESLVQPIKPPSTLTDKKSGLNDTGSCVNDNEKSKLGVRPRTGLSSSITTESEPTTKRGETRLRDHFAEFLAHQAMLTAKRLVDRKLKKKRSDREQRASSTAVSGAAAVLSVKKERVEVKKKLIREFKSAHSVKTTTTASVVVTEEQDNEEYMQSFTSPFTLASECPVRVYMPESSFCQAEGEEQSSRENKGIYVSFVSHKAGVMKLDMGASVEISTAMSSDEVASGARPDQHAITYMMQSGGPCIFEFIAQERDRIESEQKRFIGPGDVVRVPRSCVYVIKNVSNEPAYLYFQF